MSESLTKSEPGLLEFLALRARGASDGRLAVESGIGFIIAVIAMFWHGGGWALFTSAGASAFAFGLWGIIDRELRERTTSAQASVVTLRAARAGAGALGALAGVSLVLTFLFTALGTIIS